MTDTIQVGSYTLKSRLLVGTGKYRDLEETGRAIEASGADVVTMAVRRTNLGQNPNEPNLLRCDFTGSLHLITQYSGLSYRGRRGPNLSPC